MSYFEPKILKIIKLKVETDTPSLNFHSNSYMNVYIGDDLNHEFYIHNLVKLKSNYFVMFYALINSVASTENEFTNVCCSKV